MVDHSAAKGRVLYLLNELCECSLDVPLAHVDGLGDAIKDYGVSANFKELRDLIEEHFRG